MMKLSDKIFYCRKKAGLSQEALAEKIGVSRQAISKWETGEAAPEISKLPVLARTFCVTADWLLDDSAEPAESGVQEEDTEDMSSVPPSGEPNGRCMSNAAASAWPDWVEHLPGWIGRMVKRFGWLFGLRIAIGGAVFTAMGFVARAMFTSMQKMSANSFNRLLGGGMGANENAGMTFYDNAGNIIDPGAWGIDVSQFGVQSGDPFGFSGFSMSSGLSEPFAIFCNFIIAVGLVLLIGGAVLAWYLKKWGKENLTA